MPPGAGAVLTCTRTADVRMGWRRVDEWVGMVARVDCGDDAHAATRTQHDTTRMGRSECRDGGAAVCTPSGATRDAAIARCIAKPSALTMATTTWAQQWRCLRDPSKPPAREHACTPPHMVFEVM